MAKRARTPEGPGDQPGDTLHTRLGTDLAVPVSPAEPEAPLLEDDRPLSERVEADLRAGGALSRALPGYEERPAQITMARRVARALERDQHIVIEAGTGTGKSLAYLLPIVRSGKVALLSTANKALQEQLFYKDIPFVQAHIQPFEAALVKGMGNYLCLDRLGEERTFQALAPMRGFDLLEEVIEREEWDGDLDLLPSALPNDVRARVAADSDQCAWRACPFFNECYVRQMRDRAREAQVIVVNHTLLLLDAAMGGFLLPERDVVVIDEAHHLEEEATRAFTATVTPGRVNSLLALRRLREIAEERVQREVAAANGVAWEALRAAIGGMQRGRQRLDRPLEEGKRLASWMDELATSLQRQRPLNMTDKDEQLFEKLVKRTRALASDIRVVFAVDKPEERVYYVEMVRSGRRDIPQPSVSAAPLGVTDLLREKLFDRVKTIATSATLAIDGDFNFFRSRVGLEDAAELALPYAFDYANHALLYLPRLRLDPAFGGASGPYLDEIAEQMRLLVEASRGRAFLLFSSQRAMDAVYSNIGPDLESRDYATLLQGRDFGRHELLRQFRERSHAVLFGLKSFWEGVDVVGEALSLVVIDKLPFDPPDDPVQEARVSRMKAAGENWFGGYVLPGAILRLKQGVGRLIRTRDDRGVMAILDRRIYTKAYGRQVMLALPPARRTDRIEDVRQFFD
ncbi:MAG TPA: helicase C-terminal domain-containing protein [Ktedonobacterales bacterium]|nr:helicase C-terminal domain-containing protein [Ktedonobacterales bacterium]